MNASSASGQSPALLSLRKLRMRAVYKGRDRYDAAMTYIETIEPGQASGELADLYRRAGNPDGSLDEVMKAHSLNPESLRTHLEMYSAAMHRPSPLSRAERELVAVAVSRLNGCRYCLRHHLAGLKRLIPEERHRAADDLSTGRTAALTPREAALLRYATKLTMNPTMMEEPDVVALRDVGLDDRAILDLAQAVGYFAYVNRIVLGLGVTLEGGEFVVGQAPDQAPDQTPDQTPGQAPDQAPE